MVSRSSKNLLPMIRIAITPAAYDAIRSTLPQDAPLWPAERQGERLSHPCRGGRPRPSDGHAEARRELLRRQPQHNFEAHGVTEPSLSQRI
jgi:hypothetical protein